VSANGPVDIWRGWITEALSLGVKPDHIVDTLTANGVCRETAERELDLVRSDPVLRSATAQARRLRALESLLELRSDLSSLTGPHLIDVIHTPTRDSFLRHYYAANRPTLIPRFAVQTHAYERWSPAYLAETLADQEVEIMSERESDNDYEVNCNRHRSALPFSDYVRSVTRAGRTNDIYLVANNRLLSRPAARCLLKDLNVATEILDPPAADDNNVFLWFGAEGTVTPLHYDLVNVLFVQIYGRKRFTLVSPFDTHRLYNHVGVYSQVDPDRPDYERYPRSRLVRTQRVVLQPGDALFVPVAWWHKVESLDISISVSFTNFIYRNTFAFSPPPEH
jgi:ribosomal protein L16 Arg81 hydroxylase